MPDELDNDEVTENEDVIPKKSKLRLIIAIIVPANLIVVFGVLFLTGVFSKSGGEKKKEAEVEEKSVVEKALEVGPLVSLEPFVVNIKADDEGTHYLKAAITVELVAEHAKVMFQERAMIVRNEVLMYLSSLDMEKTKGVKNKKVLQSGLEKKINERLKSKIIKGVYFTEFVTQ